MVRRIENFRELVFAEAIFAAFAEAIGVSRRFAALSALQYSLSALRYWPRHAGGRRRRARPTVTRTKLARLRVRGRTGSVTVTPGGRRSGLPQCQPSETRAAVSDTSESRRTRAQPERARYQLGEAPLLPRRVSCRRAAPSLGAAESAAGGRPGEGGITSDSDPGDPGIAPGLASL